VLVGTRETERSPAPCASCHEIRPLVGVSDGGGSVCGPCSGDGRNWICDGCGQVDLLIGGARCLACTAKARVRELLAGPDGQILTQLEGVATFLLEDNTPERTQEILNGSGWIQVLGDLVATGNPLTHQVLDELPQDNRVGHLRNILVHAGALDAQAEGLDALGPWLKRFLAGVSPRTAQLLQALPLRRYWPGSPTSLYRSRPSPTKQALRAQVHRRPDPVRQPHRRRARCRRDSSRMPRRQPAGPARPAIG
jgi:hypothetical protein